MSFRRGHLLYFVTVAEEGQMTRAARRLHLAQPALSHAIAQLEGELGLQLLERHSRGVSLTAAGEVFLVKAKIALKAIAEAEHAAESIARAPSSLVELGFVGDSPMSLAPELMTAFAAGHPDACLGFRHLGYIRDPTEAWLSSVDVAICFAPVAGPHVAVQPLRVERRAALLPATHPLAEESELTVDQLLDQCYVGVDPSVDAAWAGLWRLDDHRGGAPREVTADRATMPQEMVSVVACGRGITMIPASTATAIELSAVGVAAVPVRDADPVSLALCWPVDNLNPLVGDLVKLAAEIYRGARIDAAAPLSEFSG